MSGLRVRWWQIESGGTGGVAEFRIHWLKFFFFLFELLFSIASQTPATSLISYTVGFSGFLCFHCVIAVDFTAGDSYAEPHSDSLLFGALLFLFIRILFRFLLYSHLCFDSAFFCFCFCNFLLPHVTLQAHIPSAVSYFDVGLTSFSYYFYVRQMEANETPLVRIGFVSYPFNFLYPIYHVFTLNPSASVSPPATT